jgi:hypothetical protein
MENREGLEDFTDRYWGEVWNATVVAHLKSYPTYFV